MADCLLDLKLRRAAIAGKDFFDLGCGVIHDLDVMLHGGQADHPSRMAHQNGRRRPIVVRIELLNRYHVRLQRSDHINHASMDCLETFGE